MTWPHARAVMTSASLRARLVFLTLLTMLPLAGVLVAGAFTSREDVLEAARHRALELAQLGAEQQDNVLREAKTLLTVLSRLPDITEGDLERCHSLLKQVLGDHPHMAEFALMDAQEEVLCTNRSVSPNLNMLRRPYVRRLLAPGAQGFDTSDLTISKTSGISTVFIGLSLPPKPGALQPSGVLVAGLNLGWLSDLAAKLAQGDGDIAALLHMPEGATLARYPDGATWTGQRVPNAPAMSAYNRTSQKLGTVEGKGPDGIERIYVLALAIVSALARNQSQLLLRLADNEAAPLLTLFENCARNHPPCSQLEWSAHAF